MSIRKTVSTLKQSFEQSKHDSSAQASSSHHHKQEHHKPGLLANMLPQKKLAKVQQAAQPSIDAIIGTAASIVPSALRPSTSKHPSWIGSPKPPERPITPGISRMEYPVTIEFYLPGTQPPVYIATDLSKPQWRPVEMDSTPDEDGEYRFSMTFEAKEGEYQYKLRLGPGDWWICDDSVPKITDEAGNENNAVLVKPETKASATDAITADSEDIPMTDDAARQDSHQADSEHLAPLMPHEMHPSDKAAKAHEHAHLTHKHSQENLHEAESHSPLFRHETLAPPPTNDDLEGDDEPEPSSQEQEHSPLFRHESIAMDNQQHYEETRKPSSPRSSSRKHSTGSIPEEADPNDPTLERFPTDHRGIIEHIDRTRRSMQEDETSEDVGSPQRHTPPSSVLTGSTPPSLPSVREDDGEEAPEEDQTPAQPGELDPNGDVPQVMISEPQDRPFAPMTPPMTPKGEQEAQLDDAPDASRVDTPMSVHEKVHHFKKKAHHKAKQAANQAANAGLPALAVAFAIALAAASAALSIWYIKTKSDNIVL